MVKDILKLSGPCGSPIVLVFWLCAPIPSFKGTPQRGGGTKYTGWQNFAIFNWNHHLSWKWYEI